MHNTKQELKNIELKWFHMAPCLVTGALPPNMRAPVTKHCLVTGALIFCMKITSN